MSRHASFLAVVLSSTFGLAVTAMPPLVGGAVIGAFTANAAHAAMPTVHLAPHRAVYNMKLGGVRNGSATVDARGAMYVEWAESCEGWTVTQRVQLTLSTVQGDDVSTDSNYSSWESKDGLRYRFTVRNLRDGELSEEFRGEASLNGPGAAGTAIFTMPAGTRVALPKAAIFPTEHVVHLIEHARAGESIVSRVIFDGASLDGPLEVNAVIGKARATSSGPSSQQRAPKPSATNNPLTAGRSWPVRLAFFPVQSLLPEPEYEVGMRLFENGVADQFVLDYGDFVVNAAMEKIEALPKPKC